MPRTTVVFYMRRDGSVPVLEWMDELQKRSPRARAKCRARITQLAEFGHELRRPKAAFVRGGIYELRCRVGRAQFRILYFFHGRGVVVLSHGLTKERVLPDADIDRARRRRRAFEADPAAHTYGEDPL